MTRELHVGMCTEQWFDVTQYAAECQESTEFRRVEPLLLFNGKCLFTSNESGG